MASGDLGEHESYMQDEILQSVQDTSHLVVSLATFLFPGNNEYNSHRVLVLPLMGPHLDFSICEEVVNVHSHVCCSAVAGGVRKPT